MSTWHHFYQFWVGQQTLPGNILGDIMIAIGTFLIGKYKIAPWLKARHQEHLDLRERQHRELLAAHQDLLESHHRLIAMHERQHEQLLAAISDRAATVDAAIADGSPPADAGSANAVPADAVVADAVVPDAVPAEEDTASR